MPTRHHAAALTLIELLVAISLMVMLTTLATMTFVNVDKATVRTIALVDIHRKATALMQRLEGDFENLQPHVAINLTDHHITFVRAHAEGLDMEESGSGSGGNNWGGRYEHDLMWVRWNWRDGRVFRSNSPPGNIQKAITPQQFYHYFEPVDLPDRFDPTLTTIDSDIANWLSDSLGPVPQRDLDIEIYWRPEKLWWHPGNALGRNRGVPGTPMALELGDITEQSISDHRINSNTFSTPDPLAADPAGAPELAFAMVNEQGWTVNRDYMHLVGVHPGHLLHQDYPAAVTPMAEQVLNLQFTLFDDDYNAAGDLVKDGAEKNKLLADDNGTGAAAYAGMPMNPSAELDPAIGGLDASSATVPAASRDFDQRPVKVEVSFVMHSIPMDQLDIDDVDGDLVTDETMAGAIFDLEQSIAGGGNVADAALVDRIATHGYVAVAFTQAVILPH